MISRIKRIGICVGRAAVSTVYHDGIELAGYLAFLTMLALFPFLVLLVATAGEIIPMIVLKDSVGEVVSDAYVSTKFVQFLIEYLPNRVATALEPRITEILSGPPQGLVTLSVLGAIWTASSIVEGVRTVLNRAYRVETPPAYPLRRLLSIGQLLVALAVINLMMLAVIFLPVFRRFISPLLELSSHIDVSFSIFSFVATTLVLTFVVAFLYYVLPNIKQRFLRTLPGAFSVGLLWMGGAWLFSFYLSSFNQVNLIYGSLGGIIASLLFFYIMAVIFIFGAEFNYFLERAFGHVIQQKQRVPENAGPEEVDDTFEE